MKHVAAIQAEFLKEAIHWDGLSRERQQEYLDRHPKSKRKLTGKSRKQKIRDAEKSVRKYLKGKKLNDAAKSRAKELMAKQNNSGSFKSVISIKPSSSDEDIAVAKYIMTKGSYAKKGIKSGSRVRTLLDALKSGVVKKIDVDNQGYFYFKTKDKSVYDPANLELMAKSLKKHKRTPPSANQVARLTLEQLKTAFPDAKPA